MEVFGNFRRIQQNTKLFSLTALIAVILIAVLLSPSGILLGAFCTLCVFKANTKPKTCSGLSWLRHLFSRTSLFLIVLRLFLFFPLIFFCSVPHKT